MFIKISNPDLRNAVIEAAKSAYGADRVTTDPKNYTPGNGNVVVATYADLGPSLPIEVRTHLRWAHLSGAAEGKRVYGPELEYLSESPMHGGDLTDPEQILRDAAYVDGRAKYLHDLKVKYIGRTAVDPKNIVLLDHKGSDPLGFDAPNIAFLVASLPEGDELTPWSNTAFVAVKNVDHLADLADFMPGANFVAFSESAKAKLRHIGRDFAEIEDPADFSGAPLKYGIRMRAAASSLRPFN